MPRRQAVRRGMFETQIPLARLAER